MLASPLEMNPGKTALTGSSMEIYVHIATHFSLVVPGNVAENAQFAVTVRALDSGNATVIGYAGTVHITSSDGSATLPSDATLTNGVGAFLVTLNAIGTFTVTATDTVTGSITGTSAGIVVAPGTNATELKYITTTNINTQVQYIL